MDNLGERIRWLRKNKKLTLDEVASATNVPRATLSRIEKNEGRTYADSVLLIADYFKASLEWIYRGIGDPFINNGKTLDDTIINLIEELSSENQKSIFSYMRFLVREQQIKEHSETYMVAEDETTYFTNTVKENSIYVPILGNAAAGNPILAEEVLDGFIPIPEGDIKGNVFLVRIDGESMIEADINNGDLVMVKPQPVVENGEIALVKYNGEVTVKYFYRDNSHIRLKPANPKIQDIIITDLSLLKVLGKVIKIIPQEEANRTIKHLFNNPE